ncbi:MAG: hypothetical protein HQK53_04920 [Oligoflexia bacterium]|nr:hypothetical protein [Oligoflexia bacterium]
MTHALQKLFLKSSLILCLMLFLISITNSAFPSSATNTPPIEQGNTFVRPESIQAKVDSAFNELQKGHLHWLFDGSFGGYGLMGIREKNLLNYIIANASNSYSDSSSDSSSDNDIYILDIGAGGGGWGDFITGILTDILSKLNISKRIHIFSITGGSEQTTGTTSVGNITHHRLANFKIENIIEELQKRGFDLNNKVNLIVSSWCLRHLVDPLGTLKQLYAMLSPHRGILMTNGFFAVTQDDIPSLYENTPWEKIITGITASSAKILFMEYNINRSHNQCMILKESPQELLLPFTYTGETVSVKNAQCASEEACVFSPTGGEQQQLRNREKFEQINASKAIVNITLFWTHTYRGDKELMALIRNFAKEQLADDLSLED